MTASLHLTVRAHAGDIRFEHGWIADGREAVHASIRIGPAALVLSSPAEAEALITVAAEAKAELIRLEAERRAAEGGEPGA